MDLISAFKRTRGEHWGEGVYWLLLSAIGGILPFWGSLLLLPLFSQSVEFNTFTKNAEFALYSASMLSAAIYVVTKENKRAILNGITRIIGGKLPAQGLRPTFPGQPLFVIVSLGLLTASALLFAGTTLGNLPDNTLKLNFPWLHYVSLVIFGVTLTMSYVITVLDIEGTSPSDIEFTQLQKEQERKLENRFDELQKGDDDEKQQ